MWYSEHNYPQLPTDLRSQIVADANLLSKMGKPMDPVELYELLTQDDPMVDWWSIAEYIDDIEISEVRDTTAWPETSNAIMKFRRIDAAAGGAVDHYCLVADHRAHAIIDSLDGVIKSAAEYGESLGYASYIVIDPAASIEDVVPDEPEEETVPYKNYVLGPGENLWDAARKLRLPVSVLIELNTIDDPRTVKEGYRLRLPEDKKEEQRMIRYEPLDTLKRMHVSHPGGTKKQAFGNITKWEDVVSTGSHYKENQNVLIVAIAYVPIIENGKEIEAAYYMDSTSFGDYDDTGKVAITTGFNHSHLGEGHVEQIPVKPNPVVKETIQKAVLEAEKVVNESAPDDLHPNTWKSTYLAFPEGPQTYYYLKDMVIHDIDERRPSKTKFVNHEVILAGTFSKNNIVYGRPTAAVEKGWWFGVPMTDVGLESKLFEVDNTPRPLAERVVTNGPFTFIERYWTVPFSRTASLYTKLKTILHKRKNKKKEKQ